MPALINPLTQFVSQGIGTAIGPFEFAGDGQYAGYTLVGKYLPNVLQSTGSKVRLWVKGPLVAGRTSTLSAVYIGLVATSGNAYNFDGNQVQVTFAGSGSITLTQNQLRASDEISFTLDGSKAVLIAYNIAASTVAGLKNGLTTDYTLFVKAATAEASTTSKGSGYTAVSGFSPVLHHLETTVA